MVNVLKKFGGALMLYAVIFFGIVAICSRVSDVNQDFSSINDEMVALHE